MGTTREGKCRKRARRKTEKEQGIYIKGAICKGWCVSERDVGVGDGRVERDAKKKRGSSFSF